MGIDELCGKSFEVEAEPDWQVWQLKQTILVKTGLKSHTYDLVKADLKLRNNQKLKELADDSCLTLLLVRCREKRKRTDVLERVSPEEKAADPLLGLKVVRYSHHLGGDVYGVIEDVFVGRNTRIKQYMMKTAAGAVGYLQESAVKSAAIADCCRKPCTETSDSLRVDALQSVEELV